MRYYEGMKRLLLSLILTGTVLSVPLPAAAHVLLTDGNIGLIFHVDPNDDPIAGSKSTFYMDFKDKTSRFSLQKCTCTVAITKDNKPVFQATLASTKSALSYALQYEFPDKGIFHITIKGQPKQAGAFDGFTLETDTRVARDASGGPVASEEGEVGIDTYVLWGVIVAAAVAAGVTIAKRRAKTRRPAAKKRPN